MAKYTILLSEFLCDGGELPSNFSLIENLDKLFIERYCDCEIAFETPYIFEMKLDMKAEIVVPEYVDKITLVNSQISSLNSSDAKIRTETRTYGEMNSSSSNSGSNTDLPYDEETALPSSKSSLSSDSNIEEHTDIFTFNDGMTAAERLDLIQRLQNEKTSLYEALLNEFKSLFMEIY